MLNKFEIIEPIIGSLINNCDLFEVYRGFRGKAIVITHPRDQTT